MAALIKGRHSGIGNIYLRKMKNCCYKLLLVLFAYLVCASSVCAQSNVSTELAQQFNNYQQNNFQEKIFVHTDKNFYLAGETMWFKIYNVDENFYKPTNNSSIAYVELLDNTHHAILQAKISLADGLGNGSFVIPTTIPSGHFLLRAYTNWMKNFSADFYFEKTITIANTVNKIHFQTLENAPLYDVQFFPEGGNLVAGIASKVAFKITDSYGHGIDASGIVKDENNVTVATIKTMKFGMGNFIFTPKSNIHYKGFIKINDTTVTANIPDAYASGDVMRLVDVDSSTIKISVFSNTSSEALYLFVQSHDLLKEIQTKPAQNAQTDFFINKNILADGISQFTIFDAQRHPVCERLYFKNPSKQLNISISTDKTLYEQKSKGALKISATDIAGMPVNADISLAIIKIDSLQKIDSLNIFNYFLLASDLKGIVESPQYYFLNNDENVKEAADNLMLTQGWRRFNWEDILNNSNPQFSYLPEREGFFIRGNIVNATSKNITGFISVPGKTFDFTTSNADANGNIVFNLPKFYDTKEIILQAKDKNDSLFQINLSNSFSDQFQNYNFPIFSPSINSYSSLKERNVDVQVENLFDVKHNFLYNETNVDTLNFYGKPDWQFYLDNYTRFHTMEEVLHEYVTDVRVRKTKDNYIFNVGNDNYKTFFTEPPLVLIDGIPVFDNSKIMEVNPLKIKRLDVVARKFYSGSYVSNGIISFATYNGDLSGYQLDPNAVVVEYEGIQKEREFYSPVYTENEKVNNHLPDFRNVLLWQPDIALYKNEIENVSFYTSGISGNFAVIIQGITKDGECGSKIATFDVK